MAGEPVDVQIRADFSRLWIGVFFILPATAGHTRSTMALRRVAYTALALSVLLTLSALAAPKFNDWQAPVNLGPIVNSSASDAGPAVSKSGLSLYFNSNRPGGVGGNDLWVSRWDRTTQTWGIPQNLGPVVNTAGIEASPALSRDEHWLFFHSNRGGNMDIWASYREHTH